MESIHNHDAGSSLISGAPNNERRHTISARGVNVLTVIECDTRGPGPKWNLLGSSYVVMESPKNDGFPPQTKHTSAIRRAVFDRVHHSQNGWHRNRTEVGSVARVMVLVSQSSMSEPDSFIALPNHHFHACPAHQYRTSLYQFLSPGLPAHRTLCLVCGPLYSGPPGDL